MKTFLLLGLTLACLTVQADEAKPPATRKKVIDVGNLEIKGEIRKPFIQYLDSERSATAALPTVAGNELKDYEESLLKAATTATITPKSQKQKGKTHANP